MSEMNSPYALEAGLIHRPTPKATGAGDWFTFTITIMATAIMAYLVLTPLSLYLQEQVLEQGTSETLQLINYGLERNLLINIVVMAFWRIGGFAFFLLSVAAIYARIRHYPILNTVWRTAVYIGLAFLTYHLILWLVLPDSAFITSLTTEQATAYNEWDRTSYFGVLEITPDQLDSLYLYYYDRVYVPDPSFSNYLLLYVIHRVSSFSYFFLTWDFLIYLSIGSIGFYLLFRDVKNYNCYDTLDTPRKLKKVEVGKRFVRPTRKYLRDQSILATAFALFLIIIPFLAGTMLGNITTHNVIPEWDPYFRTPIETNTNLTFDPLAPEWDHYAFSDTWPGSDLRSTNYTLSSSGTGSFERMYYTDEWGIYQSNLSLTTLGAQKRLEILWGMYYGALPQAEEVSMWKNYSLPSAQNLNRFTPLSDYSLGNLYYPVVFGNPYLLSIGDNPAYCNYPLANWSDVWSNLRTGYWFETQDGDIYAFEYSNQSGQALATLPLETNISASIQYLDISGTLSETQHPVTGAPCNVTVPDYKNYEATKESVGYVFEESVFEISRSISIVDWFLKFLESVGGGIEGSTLGAALVSPPSGKKYGYLEQLTGFQGFPNEPIVAVGSYLHLRPGFNLTQYLIPNNIPATLRVYGGASVSLADFAALPEMNPFFGYFPDTDRIIGATIGFFGIFTIGLTYLIASLVLGSSEKEDEYREIRDAYCEIPTELNPPPQ